MEARLKEIVRLSGPQFEEVGGYIFNGRGKRIRPALFLIAAYRPGNNLQLLVDAAVAFELVHTASLLHDDVIDQASLRRGRDTVHTRWRNKVAVLYGDYLLARAFQILVSYEQWPFMDVVIEMVRNMTEGEIEQAFADVGTSDLEERYFQWIGKKSASFFAACCRTGSMLGGDRSVEQEHWAEFGFNLGIAFQLIDDLLDYTGKGAVTGKPELGDLNNRVITLPLIRTLEFSRHNVAINNALQNVVVTGEDVTTVAQAVLEGDGPEYTRLKAKEYVESALSAADKLENIDSQKLSVLKKLAGEVLERNN